MYDNPSAYGVGSVFHILHQLDGKILVIGLPWQQSMTFVHYVEEQLQIPYRYFKAFPGRYRDATGEISEREYFLYVRNEEMGVETYVHDAERHFLEEGLAIEVTALNTRFTIVSARTLYDETIEQLRRNPYFLHRIEAAPAHS